MRAVQSLRNKKAAAIMEGCDALENIGKLAFRLQHPRWRRRRGSLGNLGLKILPLLSIPILNHLQRGMPDAAHSHLKHRGRPRLLLSSLPSSLRVGMFVIWLVISGIIGMLVTSLIDVPGVGRQRSFNPRCRRGLAACVAFICM